MKVSWFAFYGCDKHCDQSKWAGKGIFQLTAHHGGKSENWREKLNQKPWKNAAYWLAPGALLALTLPQACLQ